MQCFTPHYLCRSPCEGGPCQISFTPHYLCRSPYGGDLVRQLQVNIPLKPLPLALDPFPDLRCLWH